MNLEKKIKQEIESGLLEAEKEVDYKILPYGPLILNFRLRGEYWLKSLRTVNP